MRASARARLSLNKKSFANGKVRYPKRYYFSPKTNTSKGIFSNIILIFIPEKVSNMNNLPLNEFVKSKRKSLGLSREEFAQKAGVGLRFLRELEQGKETLKMDKVNQVLKLFGTQLGAVPMDRNKLIEP